MEYISSSNRRKAVALLRQIRSAIANLNDWNKDVESEDDYYSSPGGMKNLAASCMLIEAIGEGFKQIDKLTGALLLAERPEIPWRDVVGIRNHIAHGYFDIDGGIVFNTVKDDLGTIEEAVNYFIKRLESATDEA